MIRTIVLGSCVFVQGVFIRNLSDGRISVRVGEKVFEGDPVSQVAA